MSLKNHLRQIAQICILIFAASLAGCGGGTATTVVVQGGGGVPAGAGTLVGQGVKGPFAAGAQVQAFTVVNGVKAQLLASGTTDAAGNFDLPVQDSSYGGPVIVEISGTFLDEATGQLQTTGGSVLRGAIPRLTPGGSVTGIRVTPLTHLALALATARGAVTETGLLQAFSDVGQEFGVSAPQVAAPLDPSRSAAGVDPNSVRYGLVLAGLSQEAETKNVPVMTLVNAASLDAADGSVDGLSGGLPIPMATNTGLVANYDRNSLTGDLAAAIGSFVNSPQDGTGLTPTDSAVVTLQQILVPVNHAPVASAQVSATQVIQGAAIALDGSSSSDPDGDVLTFHWTVAIGAQPVSVQNGSAPQASFTAAAVGTYTVTLTVTDPDGLSHSASLTVVASSLVPPPPASLSIGSIAGGFLSRGQTMIVTVPVTNSGGRAANIAAVQLTLINSDVTVTVKAGNPSSVAAGTTANFSFDLYAPVTAIDGTFHASVQVTGSDSLSGAPITVARLDAGTVTVLPPGAATPVNIGLLAAAPPVTPGQLVTLSLPVTNPGTLPVEILSANLDFSTPYVASNVTAASPTRIPAGGQVTLQFSVQAGASLAPGSYPASASIQGRTVPPGPKGVDALRDNVGSLDVVDVARLRIDNLSIDRSVVSRGGTVNGSFTLSSVGGATANLAGVTIRVGSASLAPSSPAVPSSMAPGQSVPFQFSIDTAALALGQVSVTVSADALDAVSGNPVPVQPFNPPPTLDIQAPAELAIAAFGPTGSVVSLGQTVLVTMTIRNQGGAASNPTTASLKFFQGALEVTAGFTVAPSSGNPVSLAGGASAVYRFNVTPKLTGPNGSIVVRGTVTGTDVNSTFALTPPAANLTWTLQRPGNLSLGATLTATTATQGQSFTAVKTVTNGGEAAVLSVSASLGFSGNGVTVAPRSNPTSIPAGARATFTFDVTVGANATPGDFQATFIVSGRDGNSGDPVSATQSPDFVLNVQTAPVLSADPMEAPTSVSLGQTFLVTVPVVNQGLAAAIVTTSSLRFSGTRVTAVFESGPSRIEGVSSSAFGFRVSASLGAQLGARTATFTLGVKDANTGQPTGLTNIPVGSIQILSPGRLAIADITQPAAVSLGQSFVVTVQVQNTGQAAVILSTGSLTLYDAKLPVVPRDNPTTIAGGDIVAFVFDGTVAADATIGPRTAGITLTGTEVGTGDPVSAIRANAGTIQVQTPPALSFVGLGIPRNVSQGQSLQLTCSVVNSGGAAAALSAATLTFDSLDGLVVSPAVFPATIAGSNGSGTISFNVTVGSNALLTTRTVRLQLGAADANSGKDASISRSAAYILTVQSPADLTTLANFQMPSRASQGDTFDVIATLQNNGLAAATVTTVTLGFDSFAGLAIVAAANPVTIPGFSTADYRFTVVVAADAPLSTRNAKLNIVAEDSNSKANISLLKSGVGAVIIQDLAQLDFFGGLAAPSSVSPYQTFVASYTVQNTAQGAATVEGASLSFPGTTDLQVVPQAPVPTTIAGGGAATFSFDVTVASSAAAATHVASATVTAVDTNSGVNRSLTDGSLGSVTVLRPAEISVGGVSLPFKVSQGQTFDLVWTVRNDGDVTAIISGVTATFSESHGLTPAPSSGNPTSIAAHTTANFSARVAVASDANPTLRTAMVTVSAIDANSGRTTADYAPHIAPAWVQVQTPANVGNVGSFLMPGTASIGQTFGVVATVLNSGQAAASITTVTLTFDNNVNLIITPGAGNPTSIAGGASADYAFSVKVGAGAQLGQRSARLSVLGYDTNSRSPFNLLLTGLGSVTIQVGGPLVFSSGLVAQASVSLGQPFVAQYTVLNNGSAAANLSAPTLDFGGGLYAAPRSTNRSTIAANSSETLVYDVTVDVTATTGTHSAAATVNATDANSGALIGIQTSGLGSIVVQRAATVGGISAVSMPAVVSRGQSFTAAVDLGNGGEATLNLSSVALTFASQQGLQSDLARFRCHANVQLQRGRG